MLDPISYYHAAGAGIWIGHMIVSSIIHGLIYGVIFKVMRDLDIGTCIALAVVVIGGIWFVARRRDRG